MAGLIGVRVTIEDSKLQQVISRLPLAADEAAEMTADVIAQNAQAIVPVRTGFLRSTIQKAGGGSHWIVTATAAYAIFVEFGTRFMAAQPFLRPAAEMVDMSRIVAAFHRRLGL